MPTYSGAFAFGADGQPFAVVSDGDFDTTLWSGAGGSWTMTDKLPGTVGMYGQGLAVDSSGALHAALWGELKSSVDTYAGSWVTQAFSPLNGAPMSVITVSTTSVAHVAYWGESPDSGVNGEDLYWWTPPRAPEVVSAGTSSPNEENIGLVTSAPDATNPDGKPHVVFEATLAGGDMAVVYATRTGPSAWTSTSIVEDTPSTSQNNCDPLTPTSPTDTCSYDYTTHQPVGIAASQGGDVRIFFATRHFAGTVGAECGSPGNPVACSSWNPPSAGSETDTVSVAWLTTAGTVQTTPIATTHQPSVATLAIDATGVMHLALYDAVTSSTGNVSTTDFSTRYLRIGSAGQ
jgi:hypothetical protein